MSQHLRIARIGGLADWIARTVDWRIALLCLFRDFRPPRSQLSSKDWESAREAAQNAPTNFQAVHGSA
eukprot:15467202-Alexandrium_andersonii.AAC.1